MFGPRPLVPREFEVPRRVETDRFVLTPLTVDRFHLDYESYMSSVEHLQATFDLDGDQLMTGEQLWPAGSDLEFALIDAAWCHMEWKYFRSSFSYSVLDLAETRQLGCGYVFPCHKVGFDALCETWVRKDEFDRGFDDEFYEWFRSWVEQVWPFSPDRTGWPGRATPWEEWNALPEKP
jgi:hypothetical protein